jgi:hypothetical protein
MDKLPALKPLKLDGNLPKTGDVGNKDLSYLQYDRDRSEQEIGENSKLFVITSYWRRRTGSFQHL